MNNDVFWRRDGTAIPVEYSANPLMEEGSVSGRWWHSRMFQSGGGWTG